MNLSKSWLYLIFIGVGLLVIATVWEIYQIASGNRATFNVSVVPMENTKIFIPKLEEHIKNDPTFKATTSTTNTTTK